MMEEFYDTGYDYAGIDIYVGVGIDDPAWRDLPFIAQYDAIQDLREGRLNLSAKSALIHGGSTTSMMLGAHWATTKGLLEPAIFNLRHAQWRIHTLRSAAMAHAGRGIVVGLARASPWLVGLGLVTAGVHGMWENIRSLDWVPQYNY